MITNYVMSIISLLNSVLIKFLMAGSLTCIVTLNVDAQKFRLVSFKGYEGTFSIKSFTVNSNIKELQNLQVIEEGGHAGIIIGNRFIRTTFKMIGLYYSTGATPHTTNLFESGITFNFFPLQFLKVDKSFKVEPYFNGGTSFCIITFRGHYLDLDGASSNYSYSDQPYIGRTQQMLTTISIGVNWNIMEDPDFVQLFLEGSYGAPFTHTGSRVLSETTVSDMVSLMIGVRFGAKR